MTTGMRRLRNIEENLRLFGKAAVECMDEGVTSPTVHVRTVPGKVLQTKRGRFSKKVLRQAVAEMSALSDFVDDTLKRRPLAR